MLNPHAKMCCKLSEDNVILEVYFSMSSAMKPNNLIYESGVRKCCCGKCDTFHGLKFRLYDKELNGYIRTPFDTGVKIKKGKYKNKIYNEDKNIYYSTQMEASKDLNIPQVRLGKHLSGDSPIVGINLYYVKEEIKYEQLQEQIKKMQSEMDELKPKIFKEGK